MTKGQIAIAKAVEYIENAANDNKHGYSMKRRFPDQGTDFDCSSLVISAWQFGAGVPVRDEGANTTRDMYDAFINCGFADVKGQINLLTGAGLEKGDVLLNVEDHTAMVVNGGLVAHARSGEGNDIPGDQSGNEIRIQNYWQWQNGWNHVLRYINNEQEETEEKEEKEKNVFDKIFDFFKKDKEKKRITWLHITPGDGMTNDGMIWTRDAVKAVQAFLNVKGYIEVENYKPLEVDGECGPLTAGEISKYRMRHGLGDANETDELFWESLMEFVVDKE